jgi:hypothetical protein
MGLGSEGMKGYSTSEAKWSEDVNTKLAAAEDRYCTVLFPPLNRGYLVGIYQCALLGSVANQFSRTFSNYKTNWQKRWGHSHFYYLSIRKMDLRRLLNEPTLSPPTSPPSPTRLTEIPTFLPIEILDSQAESSPISTQADTLSWDSRNGPRPPDDIQVPRTPQKQYASATTRSDRIRIKTALDFNHSIKEICYKYSYTRKQV